MPSDYTSTQLLSRIGQRVDTKEYRELHWEGSFADYLDIVRANPGVARTAYQRAYDMILSFGREEYIDSRKKLIRYPFFHDAAFAGDDAIFGLDVPLMQLVNVFKSAAFKYGTEKRVILLHGPVGSSKSTIVRLLKRGLEQYSRTPQGALYTFSWHIDGETYACPMNEDPLRLIPREIRRDIYKDLGLLDYDYPLDLDSELDPFCRWWFNELMRRHNGDWTKVIEHVKVHRIVLSEKDRVGVGTFQPKDEKNQDATELTGDINYRRIAEYGSESDPRAFNFDGEFHIANRGIIEFIEVLKLDVAFLYDLLTATQEHKIKAKKFAQTDIDEIIIGHTNEPEYRKLQNNEFMEALRDRTVKIDIPYITKASQEVKIYRKDFNKEKIRGTHIAPHTLEMAALWSVLTRLEEPKRAGLNLIQKAKLYDGRLIPGYTEDSVKELRKETTREGMEGISARYVQDKLSNALVSDKNEGSLNAFMVMNELESGLKNHSLIADEKLRERYRALINEVKQEYEDLVKNDVQKAISADEDSIAKLCANYIDNVKAFTQREKVRNKYTGQYEEPTSGSCAPSRKKSTSPTRAKTTSAARS